MNIAWRDFVKLINGTN